MYNAIYSEEDLILGQGNIAVITGWTNKDILAKRLKPESYAVIGNLYSSRRGITPLIKNLLANPQVREVVLLHGTVCDNTSGAVKCLMDFVKYGATFNYEQNIWEINSPVYGVIAGELIEEDLEIVRRKVFFHYCENITQVVDTIERNYHNDYHKPWGEPIIYNKSNIKIEGKTSISSIENQLLEYSEVKTAWINILDRVLRFGNQLKDTKELLNLTVTIKNPKKELSDNDLKFFGFDDGEYLNSYYDGFYRNKNLEQNISYTYGKRIRNWHSLDQLDAVIKKLSKSPDTRSAVISLWSFTDLETESPPCLNHIFLRVIDSKLNLIATFRSNDMYSAWVSNIMALINMQYYIVDEINKINPELKISVGNVTTDSLSAHIYNDCISLAENTVNKNLSKSVDYYDSSGNFIISNIEGIVSVTQIHPDTEAEIKTYTGITPLKIVRQICQDNPKIKIDHIGYIGIELEKAFNNKNYIQDK